MKLSVANRQSYTEIKNILDSLAIGLQLSTDEEFEIINYMGLKTDDFHTVSIIRKKQTKHRVKPFIARVYLKLDNTMTISVYNSRILGSTIHDYEELYDYRIDVEQEEITIFFNKTSEIAYIIQILLKN